MRQTFERYIHVLRRVILKQILMTVVHPCYHLTQVTVMVAVYKTVITPIVCIQVVICEQIA